MEYEYSYKYPIYGVTLILTLLITDLLSSLGLQVGSSFGQNEHPFWDQVRGLGIGFCSYGVGSTFGKEWASVLGSGSWFRLCF